LVRHAFSRRVADGEIDVAIDVRESDFVESDHASDQSSFLESRRRRAKSAYRIGENWTSMDFEQRWADFQSEVPFERFQGGEEPGFIPDGTEDGLSCVPWMWGPEDSDNLIIFVHGFLSCPGRWGLFIKEMLKREVLCGLPDGTGEDAPRPCGKYRIMAVTLPGHGYKWENVPTQVSRMHTTEGNYSSQETTSTVVSRRDNITDMPFDMFAWDDFCEAVGALAEQFKKEHPGGTVAISGHSVGGLLSLSIAIKRPLIFNRVLILNPELGPSSMFFNPAEKGFKHLRLSVDALSDDCEAEREPGMAFPGGSCQFKFGNIGAAWSYARHLYCKRWQISRCISRGFAFSKERYAEARANFTKIKAFQMVQTRGDNAVQEKRILMFMQAVDVARVDDPNVGLCTFPKVMGHTYLVPGYVRAHPGGPRWWAPYALEVLTRFLLEGRTIPVVERHGSFNWKSFARKMKMFSSFARTIQRGDYCIPNSPKSVIGAYLTVLPAVQHNVSYEVVRPDGTPVNVNVLFQGFARKEADVAGNWYQREEELLSLDGHFLYVGRKNINTRITDLYFLDTKGKKLEECLEIDAVQMQPEKPLVEQIAKASSKMNDFRGMWVLSFCNHQFIEAACAVLQCME